MKRSYLILLLQLLYCVAFAQQRPQYTQYVFNNYLINPAISGIEAYIDLKASHRNQWTGLNGTPVTNYISVHAPIGKRFIDEHRNNYASQSHRSYAKSYQAAQSHHGIGMHAVFDKAGLISRSDINISYAFHLGLSDKVNISAGVAAGISQLSLDVAGVTLEDTYDPAISMSAGEQMKPDLGLGVWLYGPQYFVGLSAQQLLGQTLTFSESDTYSQGKLLPHYFFTAGYKFFLGPDIATVPSVLIKRVSSAPYTCDANLKLTFRDKFWLGGSYRNGDAFSALAGFNVSYLFNLGYSYDFTTSHLSTVSSGTHELILGLLLNNRNKFTCPQRYW
ncbi:MAG: type IX secretion system membrane protein PorP/SprF [Sphingobacteriaceae bacterium]|nr:type IX secretion system membrane protein PorP/SprF [Sphingobacteriaceae bacterium]